MATFDLGKVVGAAGAAGKGISSITKTGTSGLVDTYTITYTDNTTSTFTVTNGADGEDGTDGTDGTDGADGVGITSITKTGTSGLVDTYTITYSDNTSSTFTVTNGKDGEDASVTIVTSFGSPTSDSKVPSEKLVKTELDKKIETSSTTGLIKNDGTIDTTSYSTFSGDYDDLTDKPTIPSKISDLTNDSDFIETSSTSGLIKNDGTVDTTSYSTFSGDYNDLTNKPSFPSSSFTLRDTITDSGATAKVYDDGFYVYIKFSGTVTVTANTNTQLGILANLAYAPIEGYEYAPINQGAGVIYCYGAVNSAGKVFIINTSANTSLDVFGGIMYPLKSRLPSAPTPASVSLTSDKSILSYYDSESATLSATVLDSNSQPCSGETVEFFNGAISMGTAVTNASGVATKSYSSTGAGDVSFTAELGSLVSETYSIEDCIFYHPTAISYTGASTSDTVYSLGYDQIADLSNTNFEFTLTFKQTGYGCDVCLGASNEFSVTPVKSNYRVFVGGSGSGYTRHGYRTTTTTSTSGSTSGAVSLNTEHNMKITREGSTFTYYFNNNNLGSKTATFFEDYNMFGIHTVQWNTGTTTISNIKIKVL